MTDMVNEAQYGAQSVRFVETCQVDKGTALEQFRVCFRDGTDTPTKVVNTHTFGNNSVNLSSGAQADALSNGYGVTQQRLSAVDSTNPSEQNAADLNRLVPVATSGLLLVEQGDVALEVGDNLSIDNVGRASKIATHTETGKTISAGNQSKISAPITFNGTTPVVRAVMDHGPKKFALVYFP